MLAFAIEGNIQIWVNLYIILKQKGFSLRIVEESSMTHEIALLEASIFAGSKCIGN